MKSCSSSEGPSDAAAEAVAAANEVSTDQSRSLILNYLHFVQFLCLPLICCILLYLSA
jgi:hypothetical protein